MSLPLHSHRAQNRFKPGERLLAPFFQVVQRFGNAVLPFPGVNM